MNRYRSQVREVINRNTFVSLALERGFNAFLPVYDGGIDLILYREGDKDARLVQLKGRWTIDRKYLGRDIWIAFPIAAEWYLVKHDDLVRQGEAQGFTKSTSWINAGLYSTGSPSKAIIAACATGKLADIGVVAYKAVDDRAPAPPAPT